MQCGIYVPVSTLVPLDLFKAELSPAGEVPAGDRDPWNWDGDEEGGYA